MPHPPTKKKKNHVSVAVVIIPLSQTLSLSHNIDIAECQFDMSILNLYDDFFTSVLCFSSFL